MRWTYVAGVIPMAALAVAVAGCSSSGTTTPTSGSSVSSSSSPTSTSGSTTTSTSTPTSSSTGSSTSAASSGVASCTTSDLTAKIGQTEGAAGSIYVTLDLTNNSGKPCTLYGYPGVSLANGTTQISPGASRSTTNPAKLITLGVGATANAVLQVAQAANYPTSTCAPKSTNAIKIFPPNETVALYVPYSTTACTSTAAHQLNIQVVQSGS
jgi:hypothetical protein